MGTLHEDKYTFLIISRSVLLRMRNVSDKFFTEHQSTHFTFNNFFLENPTFYETTWKNIVERSKPQTTIGRMSIACWINNATYTHSEYAILISKTVTRTLLNVSLYVYCLSC